VQRSLTYADFTWEGVVAVGPFSNQQPTDSRDFLAHNLVHTRVLKIHLKLQLTRVQWLGIHSVYVNSSIMDEELQQKSFVQDGGPIYSNLIPVN
jgi:hypothetical protein